MFALLLMIIVITIPLIVLKIVGIIHFSWWIVFSPILTAYLLILIGILNSLIKKK